MNEKKRILDIVARLKQKNLKVNFKNIMLLSLTSAGGTITKEKKVKSVLKY